VIASASNSAPAGAIRALSVLGARPLASPDAGQRSSSQNAGGSAATASGAIKVASQTASAISALSPSTIGYLPPSSQGSAYSATVRSAQSAPAQTAAPALVSGRGSTLTPAQIAALTPAQLNALPSAQIGGFSVAQTQALTATQLNGVNKSTLNAINIANLSNAQVSALSASTLANLTGAQVSSLSASQIGALSGAQLAGLGASTLAALTATQAGALGAAQLQTLTATQIGGFSQAALQSLNLANLTATQLANVSAATTSKFTAAQVSSLTATQLGQLSASAVGGLSAAGIAGLSASTVAALSTKTLQSLSSAAVAALLANQATSLSTAQISSFSTAQLSQVGLVGAKGGLQFNLQWASSAASAPSGFKNAAIAAASNLSSTFMNPMVVNLQVGYGTINGQTVGAVAESESTGNFFSYAQVNAALQKDAGNSTYQAQADATLKSTNPEPGASQFYVSRAEQKALGLASAMGSGLDGYVSLSKSTQFAFNGAPQGQQVDAIGAFMHEMSEVMGRVGSVGKAVGAGVYTPLDLFRYQAAAGAGAAGTQRATTAGGQADFFSINGGGTNLGFYNATTSGDDYSDWSTRELGDPFGEAAGGPMPLTGRDAISMAVIGYNLSTNGKTLAGTAQAVSA